MVAGNAAEPVPGLAAGTLSGPCGKIARMALRPLLLLAAGALLVAFSYQAYGWGGVALVTGGIVMWMLLHVNRTMQVLRRAASRPIGYVDSAVMLNAHLKRGMTLLHVVAMTRALGERHSAENAQPEIYRWTDPGGSRVQGEFAGGKLVGWELWRPPADAAQGASEKMPP